MAEGNSVTIAFKGDQSQLTKTLEGVKGAVEGIKSQFEGLARTGELVLGFMAVEHEIKHALEHQAELDRFKATLDANGFAADEWSEKLEDVAKGLQEVTGKSKASMIQAMQMGLNMGVSADKLGSMTKQALAMSAITGMGLAGSMRQLTMAQEGHFQMFNRWIPKLREAKSETEKMVLINNFLRKGWKEATADTPEKQWDLMNRQMDKLRLTVGNALIPAVTKFVAWARVALDVVTDWVKAHGDLIQKTILWSSAIAFSVTVLPKMFAWIKTVGSAVFWLATSPLGIFLIGLGVIASAIALLIGHGDTWVERWKSGMGLIISYLDTLLGSWQGFKDSLMYLWQTLVTGMAVYWLNLTSTIQTAWASTIGYLKKLWLEWSSSGFEEQLAIQVSKLTGGGEEEERIIKEDFARKRRFLKQDEAEVDAETKAKQQQLQSDFNATMATLGQDQLKRDAEFEEKRKKLPTLSGNVKAYVDDLEGKFKTLQDKMKGKLGDAGAAPDDLALSGAGKGKKVAFEDAASLYKRIASAAAGQDPMVRAAKAAEKQVEIARDQRAILKDIDDKMKGKVVIAGGFGP